MKILMKNMFRLFIIVLCTHSVASARNLYTHDNSVNFIIGWGFQAICNHAFDPFTDEAEDWPTSTNPGGATFDPQNVKPGDIIFVRQIDQFMEKVHPYIKNPYIIITHGEMLETTKDHHRKYLEEEKIIAWFSIHPFKDSHEKFFPLPLGIKQFKKNYANKSTVNALLKDLRENSERTGLVYLNFDPNIHRDRVRIKELFENMPYCGNASEPHDFEDYLKEMAEYKFVFSPRGLGPDSYRTWEALLVGTIPIVRKGMYEHPEIFDDADPCTHSTLDELYKGLPILIVDSWEEITEDFLNKKYEEIRAKRYDIRPLYLEYWRKKSKRYGKNF